MLDRGLDALNQGPWLRGRVAGHMGRPGTGHQRTDIELRLRVPIRRRLAFRIRGGGGRHLPAGHAIDGIVQHENGHVDIATGGMNKVIAADTDAVSVAGKYDHIESGVGDLESGGGCNGASMQGVHDIGINEYRRPAGTADTRYQAESVENIKTVHGPQESVQHGAMTATGAKNGWQRTFTYIFFSNGMHGA